MVVVLGMLCLLDMLVPVLLLRLGVVMGVSNMSEVVQVPVVLCGELIVMVEELVVVELWVEMGRILLVVEVLSISGNLKPSKAGREAGGVLPVG